MNFEEKLKKDLDNIPVPEKLSPENVAKMLDKPKKSRKNTVYKVVSGLAACFVAVVSIAVAYPRYVSDENFVLRQNVSSYSSIYKKLKSYYDEQNDKKYSDFDLLTNEIPESATGTADESYGTSQAEDGRDFINTNTQVEGIDEADIIKTDGEYIYYLTEQSLKIVNPNNGSPKIEASFDEDNYIEMYIYKDKLIVISNKAVNPYSYTIGDEEIYYSCWRSYYDTCVKVYDVSDKKNIKLFSQYVQSGGYNTSRLIDGKLYLVTNKYGTSVPENALDVDEYIPGYSVNGKKEIVACEDIYIPQKISSASYCIASNLDINNAEPLRSIKAVIGCSNNVYCSQNYLYITSTDYFSNRYFYKSATGIYKLSLSDGLSLATQGKVDGYVINQFAMDEYNGYFRIATTSDGAELSSNVFVLDGNLNTVGQINNIAKTERIQSARFDGDTAYIVTFRQTDPLFKIDLSNPENPVITSELKVTGYSSYLHNWSDNLVLGLGVEADTNGTEEGVKLSMFSVSENGELSETARIYPYPINSSYGYSYSQAQYNHKALLIDPEKNLIGFPVCYHDYAGTSETSYVIYSYEDNGFVLKKKLTNTISTNYIDYNESYFERGVYIGGYIYIASTKEIVSVSSDTFETTGSVCF